MDKKNRIYYLVNQLNADAISKEEYLEFLSLVAKTENKKYFDEVLGKDLAHIKVESKQEPARRVRRNPKFFRFVAAASILVLIVAGLFFLNPTSSNDLIYTTYNGETKKITLPDDSRVSLNANSELVWSSSDQSVREVRLKGEAFFDVQKVEGSSFLVHSNDLTIQVLGTSFNVKNRNGKEEIYLEEGKLQVFNQNDKSDGVTLSSGESAFVLDKTHKITKSTDQKFADQSKWKDGVLKFTNTPVKEILEQVEAIYGVQLALDDEELNDRPMDFALPYTNWELVSEGLALALGKNLIRHDDYYELN